MCPKEIVNELMRKRWKIKNKQKSFRTEIHKMNKQLFSIEDVFTKKIYRIPDYQRGYAWGKSQLKDFWDDLVSLPDNINHYTGLLSLESVPQKDWATWRGEKWTIENQDYNAYYVVDGQQRLTTFVLFVQSFVDCIHSWPDYNGVSDRDISIADESLDVIIDRFLYEVNSEQSSLVAYKFGYCDDPSFEYLKKKIMKMNIPNSVEETFYTFNLSKAKDFFDEMLKTYVDNNSIELLKSLFKKAVTRFKVMVHYIDDGFDVYSAFETMNNRGKKLSNLELLKSRLIYLTTLYPDDPKTIDERDQLRDDINTSWKAVYKWLGKKKDAPLDDDEFLRANWILEFQFTSKRGNDYADFLLNKKFIARNVLGSQAILPDDDESQDLSETPNPNEDIEDLNDEKDFDDQPTPQVKELSMEDIRSYVICLSNMAEHWFYSHYPEDSDYYTDREKLWLDRLNRIGIAYFRPLVIASFMNDEICEDDRIRLLKEIERFIMLAFRMSGAYATYHQNEVNKKVRKLYAKEITINKVIEDLHNQIEKWLKAETEFDTKPFISRLQRLYADGNGYYAWGSLRYLLYEYERELTDSADDHRMMVEWQVKTESRKISIEHIYPQTPDPSSNWNSTFEDYSDEERIYLRGSLGNMLLLSISKNSKLQNYDYEDKKNGKKDENGDWVFKGYDQGSHSETEVANNYDNWNANSILERGLSLLSFMERRWHIKFVDEQSKKDVLFLGFIE